MVPVDIIRFDMAELFGTLLEGFTPGKTNMNSLLELVGHYNYPSTIIVEWRPFARLGRWRFMFKWLASLSMMLVPPAQWRVTRGILSLFEAIQTTGYTHALTSGSVCHWFSTRNEKADNPLEAKEQPTKMQQCFRMVDPEAPVCEMTLECYRLWLEHPMNAYGSSFTSAIPYVPTHSLLFSYGAATGNTTAKAHL